jgi:hypothetical protein
MFGDRKKWRVGCLKSSFRHHYLYYTRFRLPAQVFLFAMGIFLLLPLQTVFGQSATLRTRLVRAFGTKTNTRKCAPECWMEKLLERSDDGEDMVIMMSWNEQEK